MWPLMMMLGKTHDYFFRAFSFAMSKLFVEHQAAIKSRHFTNADARHCSSYQYCGKTAVFLSVCQWKPISHLYSKIAFILYRLFSHLSIWLHFMCKNYEVAKSGTVACYHPLWFGNVVNNFSGTSHTLTAAINIAKNSNSKWTAFKNIASNFKG